MKRKLLAVLVSVFVFVTILTVSASATTQNDWVVIDGYYHYYDEWGNEYTDGQYWIDEDHSYFRFDAVGRMLANTWYFNEEEARYEYYKADGRLASNEILNIGGYLYAFDYNYMIEGYGEFYDEAADEWRYVYATEGGVLYTGWMLDEEGCWRYYFPEGYAARNQVANVGGYLYAFNWSGQMCTEPGEVYDSEEDEWHWFRPNADGTLITGWYLDEYGDWYYYGKDGLAPSEGLTYVDGVPYYFSSWGQMVVDTIEYDNDDGCTYVIDENGSVTILNKNGWTAAGKYWYYCVDGMYVHHEIVDINGKYYFFHWDGRMLSGEEYDLEYNSELGQRIYIRAKDNGELYVNEWYKYRDGTWVYYGEDCRTLIGLNNVGGTLYLFNYCGKMLTDTTYFDGTYSYYIADSGVATQLNYNGWTAVTYDGETKWIYCIDGKYLSDQIAVIGEKAYYFDNYFMAADGIYAWYDNGTHRVCAKPDGSLYHNEWYLSTDGWYYFADDYCSVTGVYTVGETEYLFHSHGLLCTDDYVSLYDYDVYYVADANGHVVRTPGWYFLHGTYVYINEDGTLYQGILNVGGKTYVMDPTMVVCEVGFYTDETGAYLCYVLPDGSVHYITTEGMYTSATETYYVEDGKLFYGWKNIEGYWYYFDYSMRADAFVEIYNDDTGMFDTYYFDVYGKMVSNSWIKDYSWYNGDSVAYCYASENGKLLANGIYTIGHTQYYFDGRHLETNTYTYQDDGIYVVNEKGVATLLTDGDGWKQVGSDWYYVLNGILCTSTQVGIDNYIYGFNYAGKMIVDGELWNDYYFDENGHLFEGWRLIDGKWAYYEPSRILSGISYIDGAEYYFENGFLCYNKTVVRIGYNDIITVDSNGIVVNTAPINDGYICNGNGNLYYFEDGSRYYGWLGDYYFNDEGMVIGSAYYIDNDRYYFDAKGKLVRGWYKPYPDGGGWVYADEYGVLKADEWLQVGNTWYYFDDIWMAYNGIYYIGDEDKYAEFDKNGAFIGYVDYNYSQETYGTPGWQRDADGDWGYYIASGLRLRAGEYYIDGAWYGFDYEGKMFANEFQGNRYFTASGARLMAVNEWKLIDGNWVYFGADALVAEGWVNVNGVDYFIDIDHILVDENGNEVDDYEDAVREVETYKMVTGYFMYNDYVYYFDASGACHGEYVGNGWLQLNNGDFVYFENGNKIYDGLHNIGGKTYAFADGRLVTADEGVEVSYSYLVDTNGNLYGPGWHLTADGWVYVRSDYRVCYEGAYEIGGVIYYFQFGYMV